MWLAPNLDALIGDQLPRIRNIPEATHTLGTEMVELARDSGLHLMPWEDFALTSACLVGPERKWTAQDVGIVAPRRNGKTGIVLARELGGVFICGDKRIVHSAHREDTALEAMGDFIELLENNRHLERQIMKIVSQNGHKGVKFKNGSEIRFKTRTKNSGRGLGGDLVVLDEAFNIPEVTYAAMKPTLAAQPNPQVWLLSSSVDMMFQEYCEVLAQMRRRAIRAGIDPDLVYLEWSAEPGPDPLNPLKDLPLPLGDPRQIAQANPSLGALITRAYIRGEQKGMTRRGFAVERLGIGFWPPDPDEVEEELALIPVAKARAHVVDRMPLPKGAPMALAIDMTPGREFVTVSAATQRRDLGIHLEIGRHEPPSRSLTQYLVSLVYRWDPVAVVIDRMSGAVSLIPEFQQVGIEPEVTTASELVQACGGIYDDIMTGGIETITWADDPLLIDAITGSKKRNVGAGWAIDRMTGAVVSPFVAAALARYGLLKYAEKKRPPALPFDPSGQGVSQPATDSRPVLLGSDAARFGQFGGGGSLDISSARF